MSNCFCFTDITLDPDEWDEYTGVDEWNAVHTVQIGELVAKGVFDWTNPLLDWSGVAYDAEQYERVCAYFIERFYYREISLEPFEEWARTLHCKMVFEVMPKYTPIYARIAEGVNPLSDENEYYRNRTINSAYPETQLSGNSDYITDGKDEEHQRIKEMGYVDSMVKYADEFKAVDEMVLDELESMFICMYTANVNATW